MIKPKDKKQKTCLLWQTVYGNDQRALTSFRPRRDDHRQDVGQLDLDVRDRGGARVGDHRLPELLESLRKSSSNDVEVLPRREAVVLHRAVVGNDLKISGQAPRLEVPPDRELRLQDKRQVPGDAFVDARALLVGREREVDGRKVRMLLVFAAFRSPETLSLGVGADQVDDVNVRRRLSGHFRVEASGHGLLGDEVSQHGVAE